MDVFLHWFPAKWLCNTIIEVSSKSLKEENKAATCLAKFQLSIGLWFLMNTVIGFTHHELIYSREYDKEEFFFPYHLARYMLGCLFELFLSHKENTPAFANKFWELREML